MAQRYGAFIGKSYYIALTAYHEKADQVQDALQAQQEYLNLIEGKSKPFQECIALLDIIRLKKSMHQALEFDIEILKERVKVLKAPEYILDKLNVILN